MELSSCLIDHSRLPEEEEDWDEDDEEWEWEEDEDAVDDDEVNLAKVEANGINGHIHNGADEEEEDDDDLKPKGPPDIKVQGNILKIDRKDIDWSEDEYEEESPPLTPMGNAQTGSIPVPPPMPNGSIPAPPPPPPGSIKKCEQQILGQFEKVSDFGGFVLAPANLSKVEELRKKKTTRPDWNDLMNEIASFRNSHGKLNKVKCNDRSNPILTASKVGDQVSRKLSFCRKSME